MYFLLLLAAGYHTGTQYIVTSIVPSRCQTSCIVRRVFFLSSVFLFSAFSRARGHSSCSEQPPSADVFLMISLLDKRSQRNIPNSFHQRQKIASICDSIVLIRSDEDLSANTAGEGGFNRRHSFDLYFCVPILRRLLVQILQRVGSAARISPHFTRQWRTVCSSGY